MRIALLLLSAPLSFVLECLAISAFLGEPRFIESPWAEGVLLHLSGVVLGVLALFAWFPRSYAKSPLTSGALFLGFLLPMPLLGLLSLVFFRFLLSMTASDDPSKRYVMGTRTALTVERLDAISRKAHQSVLQILSGRDNTLRRNAILALRALEPKKSLPVLRRAIGDSDEQVRLLAQTQFNKIMLNLEMTIKKMEHSMNEQAAPPEKMIELAEQYHELVFLGLSTQDTEAIYLNRAVELLNGALTKDPDNVSARFFLLKCAVKQENLPLAEQTVAQLRASGFNPEFLRVWEAEILFLKRDWGGLVELAKSLRASNTVHPRISTLVEFWLAAA